MGGVQVARCPQVYFGTGEGGKVGVLRSEGNENAHVVLRGASVGYGSGDKGVVKVEDVKQGERNARVGSEEDAFGIQTQSMVGGSSRELGRFNQTNFDNDTIWMVHRKLSELQICSKSAMHTRESISPTVLDLTRDIVVDCSHGNSSGDWTQQVGVCEKVCQEMLEHSVTCSTSNTSTSTYPLLGLMLESYHKSGRQSFLFTCPQKIISKYYPDTTNHLWSLKPSDNLLKEGVSITDACMDWDTTTKVVHAIADTVREVRRILDSFAS